MGGPRYSLWVPDSPFALFDLTPDGDLRETGAQRGSITPPAKLPHETRVVADSSDRVAWLRARSQGVTATDAAKLATRTSVKSAAWEKLHGAPRSFGGSRYTDHGREREPVIAAWAARTHGMSHSSLLFHAASDRRHLATPDGLRVHDGVLELCEIKTTSKPWRAVPRSYLRQVWWQQYVLGAERTLIVWEQHDDFVPVGPEPLCRWIERDDDQIAILVQLAGELLEAIRPTQAPAQDARAYYRPSVLA